MLIGTYKVSADLKKRLCIPHKFREELGEKCVLSKDLADNCFNLYSIGQFVAFSEKIEEMPKMKMRGMRQLVYSNSYETDIDSQGRIVLSQQLCEDLGITEESGREFIVAGVFTHIQIWNPAEFEKFSKKLNSEENKKSLINDLMEIGF